VTSTTFKSGRGDGIVIIAFALLSVWAILRNRFEWLWATGILSAATIAFTFVNLQSAMDSSLRQMRKELEDNPFRGLAEGMAATIQLEWGWSLLFLGSALLIAAAAKKPAAQLRKCPHCAELVQPAAVVCKHCGRDLEPIGADAALADADSEARARRRSRAVAATIVGIPLIWVLGWAAQYWPEIREVVSQNYGVRLP
jgi:hypothetical protein